VRAVRLSILSKGLIGCNDDSQTAFLPILQSVATLGNRIRSALQRPADSPAFGLLITLQAAAALWLLTAKSEKA